MIKNNQIENEEISLLEILVKTSYHTQVTHPDNKDMDRPIAYGSGFISSHLDTKFFVTADHVLHPDDYQGEQEKRTWTDYIISIYNNIRPDNDFLSTVITPLNGFYYMESFNIERPDEADELVDITVCVIKPINVKYPFLTQEVKFIREIIPANQKKWTVKSETFVEPKSGKYYFVFGNVKTKLDGIQLKSEATLKENLKFVKKSGDYYLFNSESEITDRSDWEGLSGSPVISIDGDCVGVLCSVNENSKSIWVMPIQRVKMLMEVAIQQERLEIEN